MIKYCVEKWDKNKGKLEAKLREGTSWNACEYSDLVKLVVEEVLNDGEKSMYDDDKWNASKITEVDDGDYQGTLIYLIPRDTYQPSASDYLMTYVWYGSCSGCDALKAIQDWGSGLLTEQQVKDFMALCKDLITGMIMPYNTGWRYSEEFEPCEQ